MILAHADLVSSAQDTQSTLEMSVDEKEVLQYKYLYVII